MRFIKEDVGNCQRLPATPLGGSHGQIRVDSTGALYFYLGRLAASSISSAQASEASLEVILLEVIWGIAREYLAALWAESRDPPGGEPWVDQGRFYTGTLLITGQIGVVLYQGRLEWANRQIKESADCICDLQIVCHGVGWGVGRGSSQEVADSSSADWQILSAVAQGLLGNT